MLPGSTQADDDGPQLGDTLDADPPQQGGVELAERLVREPITESDRGRQRLLTSRQVDHAGVVLQRAADRDPAVRQCPLPVQTGRELGVAVTHKLIDLIQGFQGEPEQLGGLTHAAALP